MYNIRCAYEKYDPNGNLLWVKGNFQRWLPNFQNMKIMSDGNLLTAIIGADTNTTWQGMTAPVVNTLFLAVIDAQTGNIIRSAIVDTLPFGELNNGIVPEPLVLDENDNIYYPINTYNVVAAGLPDTVTILNQTVIIPPNGYMLARIDKNFNLLTTVFADNADDLMWITYSKGALYTTGILNSFSAFETDTVGDLSGMGILQVYRVYKLDTATLHLVWVSKPSYQQYAPNEDYLTATDDYLYMISSFNGKVSWGNDSVVIPPNTKTEVLMQFDKQTGTCLKMYLDSGTTSYNNLTTMIAHDPYNNIVIGGQF